MLVQSVQRYSIWWENSHILICDHNENIQSLCHLTLPMTKADLIQIRGKSSIPSSISLHRTYIRYKLCDMYFMLLPADIPLLHLLSPSHIHILHEAKKICHQYDQMLIFIFQFEEKCSYSFLRLQPCGFSGARSQYSGLHLSHALPSTFSRHSQLPCAIQESRMRACNMQQGLCIVPPVEGKEKQACQCYPSTNATQSPKVASPLPRQGSPYTFKGPDPHCRQEGQQCKGLLINTVVSASVTTSSVQWYVSPDARARVHSDCQLQENSCDPSGRPFFILPGLSSPTRHASTNANSAPAQVPTKFTKPFPIPLINNFHLHTHGLI